MYIPLFLCLQWILFILVNMCSLPEELSLQLSWSDKNNFSNLFCRKLKSLQTIFSLVQNFLNCSPQAGWTKNALSTEAHFAILFTLVLTMAPTLVGLWSCGHPVQKSLTHSPLTEQTRTNMSQPGQKPVTPIGNEQHVLEALWSRIDI